MAVPIARIHSGDRLGDLGCFLGDAVGAEA